MVHTEMEEIQHGPTDFLHSSSNRISYSNHHHHGPFYPADDGPRPASSIYSRATSLEDQQGTNDSQETIQPTHFDNRRDSEDDQGDENSHEKDPSRLDGWVHPALRPNTTRMSSFSAVLRAFPASREVSPSNNDNNDEEARITQDNDHYNNSRNNNNSYYHNDQIGQITAEPTVPVQTVDRNKKRRCNFIRLGFVVLALVAIVILVIGICMATGVLKNNHGSSSTDDSSENASSDATWASPSPSPSPSSFSSSYDDFLSSSLASSVSSSSSSWPTTTSQPASDSPSTPSEITPAPTSTPKSGPSKTTQDSKPTTKSGSKDDTDSISDIIPDLEIEGPNGPKK